MNDLSHELFSPIDVDSVDSVARVCVCVCGGDGKTAVPRPASCAEALYQPIVLFLLLLLTAIVVVVFYLCVASAGTLLLLLFLVYFISVMMMITMPPHTRGETERGRAESLLLFPRNRRCRLLTDERSPALCVFFILFALPVIFLRLSSLSLSHEIIILLFI